jgi:hypothetical protein
MARRKEPRILDHLLDQLLAGAMPNQPATAILLVHLVGFQRSMARLLATALWLPFQSNSPLPSDISFRSLGQPACPFEHLGFTL